MDKKNILAKLSEIEGKILQKLGKKGAYAEVALISNSQMEKIREDLVKRPDFKGMEAKKIAFEDSVNVLSFPEPEDFPNPGNGPKKLGEIYINQGITKGDFDQVAYLFIHGLLHLLGYEHSGKRDTIVMEKLEKELFLAIID